MAQQLITDSTMPPADPAPERLPRELQRTAVHVEGLVLGVGQAALAISERLTVAVACDAQQAAELAQARAALTSAVAGDERSARNLARVALVHLGRADAHDLARDQQVAVAGRLGTRIRQAVRCVGRALERLLTGRARPLEGSLT